MFTLTEIAPELNAILSGTDTKFTSCSIDTRQLPPGAIYIALVGENFDGHDFLQQAKTKGAVAAIVSREVEIDLPTLKVADTRNALGNLAKLWRQRFDLPVIAITGSNGKTTTKEMLKTIFFQQSTPVLATKGNLNNEIGVPLTLFNLKHEHRYAVVEMGANHMGEIANLTKMVQPTCAVITQCAPAHLEGFGTVAKVAEAKGEIFANLPKAGIAVINNDDAYAKLWHNLAASHQIITYGLNKPADITASNLQGNNFTLQTPIGEIAIELPLPGQHNVMNALAAAACALTCDCSLQTIQQGLQAMQPVAGRLQITQGKQGITLINDTYNANPASLNAALQVLTKTPTPHWLAIGDMGELGANSAEFHHQAGQSAKELGVEKLWAVGNMTNHTVIGFGAGGKHFANHNDLVQSILEQLPASATLLIKGSRTMQMEKVVQALQEGI